MTFEGCCWGDSLFVRSSFHFVDLIFPGDKVLFGNGDFNGVVSCGDGAHVPLNLLDFASLVQIANHYRERKTNENSDGSNLVQSSILDLLLFNALLTGELHEKRGVFVDASSSLGWVREQTLRFNLEGETRSSFCGVKSRLNDTGLGSAISVEVIDDAGVSVGDSRVDSVRKLFANLAIVARNVDLV